MTQTPAKECYLCAKTIEGDKKSYEHIIPNAIGGIAGSYDLICRDCNTRLGLEIEGDFAKSLNSFCSLLQINRDRNKVPHITHAKDEHGNRYYLENGRTPIRVQPVIEKHENHYHISAADEKQIRHIIDKIKKREPTLDTENLDAKFIRTKKRLGKPLCFPIHIGGDNFFRTIAKIAVNTYLHLDGERKYCRYAAQYIIGEEKEIPEFIHYHVDEQTTTQLDPAEVCHCVHICGNSENKILFVYVELFSSLSFIVKLSNAFEGPSFTKTYCLNVLDGKETSKTVTTSYPKNACPDGYPAHDPVFFPVMQARLTRLMHIAHYRQIQATFKEEYNLLWVECQKNYNDDVENNKRQSQLFKKKVDWLLTTLLGQDTSNFTNGELP